MSNSNNEEMKKYRSSFGSTILFSGVQIYQILIRIVRSKFVAMFIGPYGMGVTSLLRSTTDVISACTDLGLKTSGVKTVSQANASNDKDRIEECIAVLKKLILFTGLLGTIICAAFAPVWSKASFGNSDFIWSFVSVSIIILLNQLTNGELVLLQGTQKKVYLAKANVIGQTIGLIVTVPLYYFWGVKAIVTVLVLASVIQYALAKFYSSKLPYRKVTVSTKDIVRVGKEMVKLGILLSLQHILSIISVYFVRNYVSRVGGVDEVGFYSAGTTIVNMYLGLVFTAMATDYFPRLAATKSNEEMNDSIMKQAEISLLLFAPLIVGFIVFIKPVILLLYSEMFLPIEQMLYWAIAATLIKALAWSMSYSLLARAKSSVFFWNEVVAISYTFAFNMFGYKYWGLTGFGISILVSYCFYLLQMTIVTRKFFSLRLNSIVIRLFILLNIPVLVALSIKIIDNVMIMYVIGSIVFLITATYSIWQLNKRMDLKGFVSKKIKR